MQSAYIADLNAKCERDNAKREQERHATLQVVRAKITPLEDRLARHLANIPIELQREEGLSLASVQVALRGRRGTHAHAGEIGAALRKLGFERKRNWRGGEGFKAVWRRTA
jgi:hypothetical protein